MNLLVQVQIRTVSMHLSHWMIYFCFCSVHVSANASFQCNSHEQANLVIAANKSTQLKKLNKTISWPLK